LTFQTLNIAEQMFDGLWLH